LAALLNFPFYSIVSYSWQIEYKSGGFMATLTPPPVPSRGSSANQHEKQFRWSLLDPAVALLYRGTLPTLQIELRYIQDADSH
jgi:hypothetical protein